MTAYMSGSFYRPFMPMAGIAAGHTILHDVVASCLVSFPKAELRRDFGVDRDYLMSVVAPCQALV